MMRKNNKLGFLFLLGFLALSTIAYSQGDDIYFNPEFSDIDDLGEDYVSDDFDDDEYYTPTFEVRRIRRFCRTFYITSIVLSSVRRYHVPFYWDDYYWAYHHYSRMPWWGSYHHHHHFYYHHHHYGYYNGWNHGHHWNHWDHWNHWNNNHHWHGGRGGRWHGGGGHWHGGHWYPYGRMAVTNPSGRGILESGKGGKELAANTGRGKKSETDRGVISIGKPNGRTSSDNQPNSLSSIGNNTTRNNDLASNTVKVGNSKGSKSSEIKSSTIAPSRNDGKIKDNNTLNSKPKPTYSIGKSKSSTSSTNRGTVKNTKKTPSYSKAKSMTRTSSKNYNQNNKSPSSFSKTRGNSSSRKSGTRSSSKSQRSKTSSSRSSSKRR